MLHPLVENYHNNRLNKEVRNLITMVVRRLKL